MKQLVQRVGICISVVATLACNQQAPAKKFEISGKITNSAAKKIYLEEVPAGASQGTIVDSVEIAKDGKYRLSSTAKEASVYNLRLDQNMYPAAAVINDVSKIGLDIEMNKENGQFADKYEVKGSPASEEMKDFMLSFNNNLQRIFVFSRQVDSLKKINVSDSVLAPIDKSWRAVAQEIKEFTVHSIEKAKDPALVMFELGYYQSTANKEYFGLPALDISEVVNIMNEAAAKFPSHNGLAAVRNGLLEEQKKYDRTGLWTGKAAPDFSLPDVNGREISLSSFRGKYVLVDFWASWCGPCRNENPNVVKVYNEFKNKNFTVLGVSLDRPGQKAAWLKAIQADHLDWTHVSDLKWWQSSVVPLYQINGIPYNVLVDPQGMVIGENLKGSLLETKLSEVLR
jgi:peroxiredoxin